MYMAINDCVHRNYLIIIHECHRAENHYKFWGNPYCIIPKFCGTREI